MVASGIIELAHAVGMTVIAESVETLQQLQLMHKLGADEIQGYFFSRPCRQPSAGRFSLELATSLAAGPPPARRSPSAPHVGSTRYHGHCGSFFKSPTSTLTPLAGSVRTAYLPLQEETTPSSAS